MLSEQEAVEPLREMLSPLVYGGLAVEHSPPTDIDSGNCSTDTGRVLVRAYVPAQRGWQRVRRRIDTLISLLGGALWVGAPSWILREEGEWQDAWKQHFHAFRVGRRLVIKPTWGSWNAAASDLIVEMDPGMAFGTGLHPTTQLCLEILENVVVPGCSVLDLGTGSGILAIAAAKLGAARVLALDTDAVAVQVARRNVASNDLADVITVLEGSLGQGWPRASRRDESGSYTLVVSNIVAGVLCELAALLSETLGQGGVLVASGVIEERLGAVLAAFAAVGLGECDCVRKGDWVAVTCRKV